MPSSSMVLVACALGDVRDNSTPRSDVPACSPRMPLLANSASVPVTSSSDTPEAAATGPMNFSALPKSETSPCALFAAAASRSATWLMSSPASPNCTMVEAAYSAACPASSDPAAASASAPFSAPPVMSAALTPALASASMDLAASVGPTLKAGPMLRAALLSSLMLAAYSPPSALMRDICASKSAIVRAAPLMIDTTPLMAA